MTTEQKNLVFYSTEIAATLTPETASPAPATLVVIDQPPILGDAEYNDLAGDIGRGSVIQTLGGVVIQDFGVVEGDGHIQFSDTDAYIDSDVIDDLKALHETVDGEYYFTDGFNVWKVRFARPNGFVARKNLLWAQHGEYVYSYSFDLIIIEKTI
jgi:hypothetical protein